MSQLFTPRFCALCGGGLKASLPHEGGAPLVCSVCGLPVYLDPKLAVAVVVRAPDDKVLLLRRAQRDAAHGMWILPGGHVDRGEELTAAARREVREETGLDVRLTGLLGLYSSSGNPVVLAAYAGMSNGQSPQPGQEALQIKFFAPSDIPWSELGYASTGDALRDALGLRPGAGRP